MKPRASSLRNLSIGAVIVFVVLLMLASPLYNVVGMGSRVSDKAQSETFASLTTPLSPAVQAIAAQEIFSHLDMSRIPTAQIPTITNAVRGILAESPAQWASMSPQAAAIESSYTPNGDFINTAPNAHLTTDLFDGWSWSNAFGGAVVGCVSVGITAGVIGSVSGIGGPIGFLVGCLSGAIAGGLLCGFGLLPGCTLGGTPLTDPNNWVHTQIQTFSNDINVSAADFSNTANNIQFQSAYEEQLAEAAAVTQLGNDTFNFALDAYQSTYAAGLATQFDVGINTPAKAIASWQALAHSVWAGTGGEFSYENTSLNCPTCSQYKENIGPLTGNQTTFDYNPTNYTGLEQAEAPNATVQYVYLLGGAVVLAKPVPLTTMTMWNVTTPGTLLVNGTSGRGWFGFPHGGVYGIRNGTLVFSGGFPLDFGGALPIEQFGVGHWTNITDNSTMKPTFIQTITSSAPTINWTKSGVVVGHGISVFPTNASYAVINPKTNARAPASDGIGFAAEAFNNVTHAAAISAYAYWYFLHVGLGITNENQIPTACIIPLPSSASAINPLNFPWSQMNPMAAAIVYEAWILQLGQFHHYGNATFCGTKVNISLDSGSALNAFNYAIGGVYTDWNGSFFGQHYTNRSTWYAHNFTTQELILIPELTQLNVTLNSTFPVNPLDPITALLVTLNTTTGALTSFPRFLFLYGSNNSHYPQNGSAVYLTRCWVNNTSQSSSCKWTPTTPSGVVGNQTCVDPAVCQEHNGTSSSNGCVWWDPLTWLTCLTIDFSWTNLLLILFFIIVVIVAIYIIYGLFKGFGGRGGGGGGGRTVVNLNISGMRGP